MLSASSQENGLSVFLPTEDIDFSFKGYYRFMGYHRNLNNLFGDEVNPNVFRLDDEFNSPTINLEMILKSKKSGYIKSQIFLFEPFEDISNEVNFLKLNRR